MTSIALACSGWIPDLPVGNRLRWVVTSARTPRLEIQRAPLFSRPTPIRAEDAIASDDPTVTAGLWERQDDRTLTATVPRISWQFGRAVQGVRFRLQTSHSTIVIVNDPSGGRVEQLVVNPNDTVDIRHSAIGELLFFTTSLHLDEIHVCTLYHDLPLAWETIAQINTDPEVPVDLTFALSRLPNGRIPTAVDAPDPSWWPNLQALARDVWPGADETDPRLPTPRQSFELMQSNAFWLAVLTGAAFVDGPRDTTNEIDEVAAAELLTTPQAVAYRISDPTGALPPSNLALSSAWPAPPLAEPHAVTLSGTVKYDQIVASWVTSVDLEWERPPAPALGVILEQEYRDRPSGDTISTQSCEYRINPTPDAGQDLDTTKITLTRGDAVISGSVTSRARITATDGWDRRSRPTTWSREQPLTLIHAPTPPPLVTATQTRDGVILDRGERAWVPDAVISSRPSHVIIRRRNNTPAAERAVVIEAAVSVASGTTSVRLNEPVSVALFTGGSLVAASGTYAITEIEPDSRTIAVAGSTGTNEPTDVPSDGAATIREAETSERLWYDVPGASFDAHALPIQLAIDDPWAPRDGRRLYAAVVEFADDDGIPIRGSLGRPIVAVPMFQPPPAPAPFTATALVTTQDGARDADFYGRTLVEVEFRAPPPSGADYGIQLGWCEGGPDRYPTRRAPGLLGTQPTDGGTSFLEIMPLPLPLGATPDLSITIGARTADTRANGYSPSTTNALRRP